VMTIKAGLLIDDTSREPIHNDVVLVANDGRMRKSGIFQ